MSAPDPALWPLLPPDFVLSAGRIEILETPTDLAGQIFERLRALLTPEERDRTERLRIPYRRAESIVARGLVRLILGRLLCVDPQLLTFTPGPAGKPACDQCTALQFNLSHTRNRVLLAVTQDAPVGVDIEFIRPDLAAADLANRFFSPAESAAIAAVGPDDRQRAFFACWTRKEALFKATGRGIALGLATFSVPLGSDAPAQWIGLPSPHGEWCLHTLAVSAGYTAALATTDARPLRHTLL